MATRRPFQNGTEGKLLSLSGFVGRTRA